MFRNLWSKRQGILAHLIYLYSFCDNACHFCSTVQQQNTVSNLTLPSVSEVKNRLTETIVLSKQAAGQVVTINNDVHSRHGEHELTQSRPVCTYLHVKRCHTVFIWYTNPQDQHGPSIAKWIQSSADICNIKEESL